MTRADDPYQGSGFWNFGSQDMREGCSRKFPSSPLGPLLSVWKGHCGLSERVWAHWGASQPAGLLCYKPEVPSSDFMALHLVINSIPGWK